MVCVDSNAIVANIIDEIIDTVVFNRVDEIIGEIIEYYRPLGNPVPNDVRNECYNVEKIFGNTIALTEWINHRVYLWLLTDDDMGNVDNGVFRGFADYHEITGLI